MDTGETAEDAHKPSMSNGKESPTSPTPCSSGDDQESANVSRDTNEQDDKMECAN